MRKLATCLIILSPFLIIEMGYLIASLSGIYHLWFLFYGLRLIILLVLIVFLLNQIRLKVKMMPILFLILYAFEFGFSFMIQTTLEPLSYSSWLWNGLYKNPINQQGYRDADWPQGNSVDLMFIGDSFTDGHGIKKIERRFSDITASDLGMSFVNLGVSGSSTKDQLETLRSTPIRAKTIVFQYFVNDIEHSAIANGVFPDIKSPNLVEHVLVTSSFIANRFYSIRRTEKRESVYIEFLQKCMTSSMIKSDHLEDLQAVISHCEASELNLVAVVFPYLRDIKATKSLVDLAVQKFESEGVKCVDMSSSIEDLAVEKRVVNLHDVHPSAEVNAITAMKLVPLLSGHSE